MKYSVKNNDTKKEKVNESEPFKDIEWISFKKALKVILYLIFIITLLSLVFSISAVAESDLDYVFQKDTLVDTSNIQYLREQYDNTRIQTTKTNNSIATYTFNGDSIGSNPNDWTITEPTGTNIEIDNTNGHYHVLELYDNTGSDYCTAEQYFTSYNIESSFIEWFGLQTITTETGQFRFECNDTVAFRINFHNNGYITAYDGSHNNLITYQTNTWYHFRVEFKANSQNKYLALPVNSFRIFVNNIDYGTFNFITSVQNITSFSIQTTTVGTGYYIRADNIGYGHDKNNWNFDDLVSLPFPDNILGNYSGVNHHPKDTLPYALAYITSTGGIDDNYVRITDNNVNYEVKVDFQFIRPQTTGTISFSCKTENNNKNFYFRLYHNDTVANDIILGKPVNPSAWYYNDSIAGYTVITTNSITNNIWKNVTIYFDTITDTFNITINSTDYFGNYSFYTPVDNITSFAFYTDKATGSAFYCGFDLVQFSFNATNYDMSDNSGSLILYNESIYEVDSYEFAVENFNDKVDTGDDNVLGWTDYESPSGDYVNAITEPDTLDFNDMVINITHSSGVSWRGIYQDFDKNGQNIEVNVTFEITTFTDTNGNIKLRIRSKDGTAIAELRILQNGNLQYYDGSGYITLYSGITTDQKYILNVNIDYWIDIITVSLYEINSTVDLINYWMFSALVYNKQGVGEVRFWSEINHVSNTCELYVDSIGIYVNGKSISTEIGYKQIDNLRSSVYFWQFHENSIFQTNLDYGSEIQISTVQNGATLYTIGDTLHSLHESPYSDFSFYNYTFWTIRNLWSEQKYGSGSYFPIIIMSFKNNMSVLSYLSIHGTKLVQGSNEYWLDYSYGGVDNHSNYFYTDSSHRLRWSFSSITNSYQEYIQAEFNINNVYTVNRSLSFHSQKDSSLSLYFRLNYTDQTSTFYQFKDTATLTSTVLVEKTIESFIILITDGNNPIIDTDTGYIHSISLNWIPNYAVTVVTLSLLAVIIPIIILLVPTFALYKKFGKAVILPMLLIMTVICFISELIPIWIFFIMIICLGILAFLRKRLKLTME